MSILLPIFNTEAAPGSGGGGDGGRRGRGRGRGGGRGRGRGRGRGKGSGRPQPRLRGSVDRYLSMSDDDMSSDDEGFNSNSTREGSSGSEYEDSDSSAYGAESDEEYQTAVIRNENATDFASLMELRVVDLRSLLDKLSLSKQGRKEVLAHRLADYYVSRGEGEYGEKAEGGSKKDKEEHGEDLQPTLSLSLSMTDEEEGGQKKRRRLTRKKNVKREANGSSDPSPTRKSRTTKMNSPAKKALVDLWKQSLKARKRKRGSESENGSNSELSSSSASAMASLGASSPPRASSSMSPTVSNAMDDLLAPFHMMTVVELRKWADEKNIHLGCAKSRRRADIIEYLLHETDRLRKKALAESSGNCSGSAVDVGGEGVGDVARRTVKIQKSHDLSMKKEEHMANDADEGDDDLESMLEKMKAEKKTKGRAGNIAAKRPRLSLSLSTGSEGDGDDDESRMNASMDSEYTLDPSYLQAEDQSVRLPSATIDSSLTDSTETSIHDEVCASDQQQLKLQLAVDEDLLFDISEQHPAAQVVADAKPGQHSTTGTLLRHRRTPNYDALDATQVVADDSATPVVGGEIALQVAGDMATQIVGDATQVVGEEAATQALGGETAIRVERGAATQVVGEGTATHVEGNAPTQVVGIEAATQLVGIGAATQLVGTEAATQVVEVGAATQLVGGDAPAYVVGTEDATQVVGMEAAVQVMKGEDATQVVGVGAATLVVEGDAPTQVVGIEAEAEAATQVLGVRAVTQVVRQRAATQVVVGDVVDATQVVEGGKENTESAKLRKTRSSKARKREKLRRGVVRVHLEPQYPPLSSTITFSVDSSTLQVLPAWKEQSKWMHDDTMWCSKRTLGRGPQCSGDLRFADKHISSTHCSLDFAIDASGVLCIRLKDLSGNGTFLNGKKLHPLPQQRKIDEDTKNLPTKVALLSEGDVLALTPPRVLRKSGTGICFRVQWHGVIC